MQDDSLQDDRCKVIVFKTNNLQDYKLQIKVQRLKRELTTRYFQGPISCCKVPQLKVSRVE